MVKVQGFGETYTAAELIAELQKLAPNTPILTEGCDCLGEAVSIDADGDTEFALIKRPQ